MPPSLLCPRHLRPCHPLWAAKPRALRLARPLSSQRKFPADTEELSEQSLLEELFPEAKKADDARGHSPQVGLPKSPELIRAQLSSRPKSLREQVTASFQRSGEDIAVLQLEHCSTELTEADFRRLIPKGKHIDTWNSSGEFYKIIPGRDPLSLERLPFYYLLFRTADAAVAYQRNASRIHKLTAMHRPGSVLSAIPPTAGFLENSEDVHAATTSYVLKPVQHSLALHALMQPYHPALRTLFEQGGYRPIVPDIDEKDNRIFRVLLHIEGYEPSHSDLFRIIFQSSYNRGISLALRNESSSSLKRLRDVINTKTRLQPLSTANPRAYGRWEQSKPETHDLNRSKAELDDPNLASLLRMSQNEDGDSSRFLNQVVMNKVYNRWIIEFEDEIPARRFAAEWHRKLLPDITGADRTWKDYEEPKMCNCEFLW